MIWCCNLYSYLLHIFTLADTRLANDPNVIHFHGRNVPAPPKNAPPPLPSPLSGRRPSVSNKYVSDCYQASFHTGSSSPVLLSSMAHSLTACGTQLCMIWTKIALILFHAICYSCSCSANVRGGRIIIVIYSCCYRSAYAINYAHRRKWSAYIFVDRCIFLWTWVFS